MHRSTTNARFLQLSAARAADAAGERSLTQNYRGARVTATLFNRLAVVPARHLAGGRGLHWTPRVVLDVALPAEAGGTQPPVRLAPETDLRSFEQAFGFAMGAVDSLLQPAAARPPADKGTDEYRRVQQRFHQLGRRLFDGADMPGWDAVRPELVLSYTDGRESSSTALDASELMFFVARFEADLGGALVEAGPVGETLGGDGAAARAGGVPEITVIVFDEDGRRRAA